MPFASISVLLSLQILGNQGGLLPVHSSFLLTDILNHFVAIFKSFRHSAGRIWLFLAELAEKLVQKVIQVKPGLGRNWSV